MNKINVEAAIPVQIQHSLFQLNALCALATASNEPSRIPRYRRLFGSKTAQCLDDLFFQLMRKLDIVTLVECGAHEGSAAFKFATEFRKSAIAIEANPFVFREKTIELQQYGVLALNYALDTTDGQVTLRVPLGKLRTSTKGSLLRREGQATEEIDCEARSLDSLAEEHFPGELSLALWVDVEGATSRVLQGAEKILRSGRCRVIKVEVETVSYWKDQCKAREIDEFLRARDFIPVARDAEYQNQYNLIYVSADCIQAAEREVFCFWQDMCRIKLSLINWILPISLGRNRLASSCGQLFCRVAARSRGK